MSAASRARGGVFPGRGETGSQRLATAGGHACGQARGFAAVHGHSGSVPPAPSSASLTSRPAPDAEGRRREGGRAGGRPGEGALGIAGAKPPYCNTGVLNTLPSRFGSRLSSNPPAPENRLSVDWAEFTVSWGVDWQDVCRYFPGLDKLEPESMPRGLHGYKKRYSFGPITVLTDGTFEMGHHFVLTGDCLRQLHMNPIQMIGLISDLGGRFTRLDIALDDFEEHLTMDRLLTCLRGKQIVSKSRKYKLDESGTLDGESEIGRTLYIGSGKSHVLWRFYEKAREMRAKGKTKTTLDWLRIEGQFRAERAEVLAKRIWQEQNLGVVFASVLDAYISIREPGTDSNRSRWAVAGWWKKFVGLCARFRWGIEKAVPDMEKKRTWFQRQIAPTFAAIARTFGAEELERLFCEGDRRLQSNPALRQAVTLASI